MIPGKPRKSPSKRANQLARQYQLNYDDLRTGAMIKWMERQTEIDAVQRTYEGETPAEKDLLRQFTVEEKPVIVEEVMPPMNKETDDPIISLYTADETTTFENGNNMGIDRDDDDYDDDDDRYELEVLRVQHFDEVVLPALITVITTIVFFLVFSTLITPFLSHKADF